MAALSGAALVLVYEPAAPRPTATLFFHPSSDPPLTITVEGLREATWPFALAPTLRVPWRFGGAVRAVRFATARSFADPGAPPTVRVEVDLEGAAPLALEGDGLVVGPVASDPSPPKGPAPPMA